ncbi:unnamed protein product [Onchocerca flexuosa]|uniref:Transposase n=1 Tax=Onchocerca flexuosa TaxID=387005 RepID=A0A183H630_9BILA|nr:unnamed protein product [Onchocerca flexuosa]
MTHNPSFKKSDKLYLRLKTTTRSIANKYCEGKL